MVETAQAPDLTARRLIRQGGRAALATALEGWPYASLVLVAAAADGAPLLFLSDLAEHSRNLRREPRVSLLFDGTAGLADPLTGPRVTVLGRLAPNADEALAARYVARHPAAALYRGFRDFRLYRLAPERAHLVAGFGRIEWIAAAALLSPADAVAALLAAEPEVLAHMNGDHAATLDLCAHRLLGRAGAGWRLVALDPDGADLRREDETARLDFAEPVRDADGVRQEFLRLAAAAARAAREDDR